MAVKTPDPERIRRMADYARRYADECNVPNGRVFWTRRPGKDLPPGVRTLLSEHVDIQIDGHVVVAFRALAYEFDQLAEAIEAGATS